MTMTNTMNTNNANVVSNAKFYAWADKKGKVHKCVAFKLDVRLVKEPKGIEAEQSHGFARLANDVKARVKALENGTKIYWTANIAKTTTDGLEERTFTAGDFVRDDMGDRVKEAGWLVDCGATYNKEAALDSLEVFRRSVVKGLEEGIYQLQPAKEPEKKKAELVEELKQANDTINILKMRIERLERELAEAKAR